MRNRLISLLLVFTLIFSSLSAMTAMNVSAEDEGLILWYKFDEGGGTTVTDYSGNGYHGTIYGGVTWLSGVGIEFNGTNGYVKMPNGILKNLEDITIIVDVLVHQNNVNPSWIYTFGNSTDPYNTPGSTYLALFHHADGGLRGSISNNRWSGEQNVIKSGGLTRGIWKRMAYTLSGRTATLYEDGVQVARNTNVTLDPGDVENTIANYLGRPAYLQDNYFKGKIKEFRIYDRALSAQEIQQDAYQGDEDAVEQDYQQLSLGDISGITSDLTLPSKGEYGSNITWTSSDTGYITDDGKVTRPPYGTGNKTVTLTASIKKGSYEKTKEFQVTILEDISDEQKVQAALDKISIPNKDDIRGNITLPETIDGLPVVWTATPEGIISTRTIPAEENDNYAPIPAGVVTRPEADTKVELTATITLNEATSSKVLEVTVRKKPKPITENDYKGYLFTYFTGEGRSDGEQIYFATSKDGLFWDDLKDNEPILTSGVGEKGVRDPFILRSPEGDKFYMIATDLKIYGNGDWNRAQRQGSKSIVVRESTDLVNWSKERLVKVARDDAGCTWAPEIVYDDKTGEYLVFWASRIGADNYAKQRIYIAKTRDFYTFTEPQVYIERVVDVIDATIIKHDGVYYRFSKDETNKNVIMDKCDQLLGKAFTPVSAPVVEQQRGVEGPAIYKLNGENKWVLLLDNYGGRGYYPLITTDLASGDFRVLNASEYRMPTGPRHGTVISITQDEYDALMAKWYNPVIPPDEEPQEAPVLEYNFDEVKTGNTIKDVSGNNNTGTLYGNATYVTDSEKNSQVLYLDGTNNTYAAFPQGFFDGRDTFSISMDIKPETVTGNFFTFTIGKNNIKYMFLKTSETQIRNAITVNSYQNEQEVKGNLPSSIKSKWMNIKLIITPTSMTIYKDGVLLAENKNVTIKTSDLGTDLLAYLGKSFYSGDAYFKGYFDNVKVYNRELTVQEIIAESNRIKLSQLIAAYADINEAEYTYDSFNAFRMAYDQAVIVANKADATDEEVSEAIAALEDAVLKLIRVNIPDENRENLILHYEFNDDMAGGIVRDSSGKGNDGIIRGTGASMSDGILTLNGNTYVELPTGMFDRKDTLTITIWLKNETGKGNYSAMFFGTTQNYPVQYWLFNPCNPDGRFKSVITNGYNTSSPWSTEYGISPTNSAYGIAGPLTDNNWTFYTTVIEPNQITAYYNGVKIGTVAVNRRVSDFGNNLVAYLGKSSYPDILLKGSFKDVKVYTAALTEAQVKTEMTKALLAEDKAALELAETTVLSDISLPTRINNSVVTWKSSNTAIISADGKVTRPAAGQGDANVTLTATLILNGIAETKQFDILVLEDSDENNSAYLAEVAEAFELGIGYVTENITLPETIKGIVTISWRTSDASLISVTGQVNRPKAGEGNKTVTLTAVLRLGQAMIEKPFVVTVLEETYAYLLTYVVSGDTDETDSLHIAYSLDGKNYTALYNNQPIRYAGKGTNKMGSPTLFRKADGTYGLIASDNNSSSNILLYDSEDLLTYTNERLIQISDPGIYVRNPSCSFDTSIGAYRINFEGSNGKSYTTVTKDFVSFTAIEETTYQKAAVDAEKLPAGAIEVGVFELTKAEFDRILNKYSRIINTGIEPIPDIKIKTGGTFDLPDRVTLKYSDGSVKEMGIAWDQQQLDAVDTGKEGIYTVTGTVIQPKYPNPLIEERADPWVILGDDGWYYFTASYPVRGNSDPEGYDRIILRRARTIEGLKDAEEITIWHEKDSPTANRYIWAPEIHNINGKWYVLFTASRSSNVWDIRPHILACEGDGDPFKPENWGLKGQVKAAPGDTYAFTHFSLDMTYFECNGKHYLAWAEKPSSSDIMLATIDPDEPWQLTSPAVLISTPQYGWEWNGSDVINEGPAVLKHDGKIYMFFSASSVDRTYCVGMLWADENADLMDSSSWTKNAYPMLTSDDLYKEYGPGHNSFTVDAYGNVVIVYHARPEDCALNQCAYASSSELNDPCRHARVKNVHFAADGTPVLNMTYEEELDEQFRTVTAIIIVADVEESAVSLSADSVVQPGSTFTVTVSLDNLNKGVFAEDITLSYDPNVFEYVSAQGANENIHIVREIHGNGNIRIIAANVGGVTGESVPVLNLSFKVRSGVQGVSGNIAVTDAKLGIAPEGNVITPQLTSKSIQVAAEEPSTGDLNKDGSINIGDLAIAAFYYGKTSADEDWDVAKIADMNHDGKIGIEDLAFIAMRIIE